MNFENIPKGKINICIVVFGFNRLKKISNLINQLREQNEKLDTFIVLDGPITRDQMIVQKKIISAIHPILENETFIHNDFNKGLSINIKETITMLLYKYEWVIVLEDDLFLERNFIEEMIKMINLAQNRNDIFAISAFTERRDKLLTSKLSNYILRKRFSCWGFAISNESWQQINWKPLNQRKNFDKLICLKNCIFLAPDMVTLFVSILRTRTKSWAFYAALTQVELSKYSLHPNFDIIENVGFDESSTNTVRETFFKNNIQIKRLNNNEDITIENNRIIPWLLNALEVLHRKIL